MNANNIEDYEMANKPIISSWLIIKFIHMIYLCTYYTMVYLCILMVNSMITGEPLKKKVEKYQEPEYQEQEEHQEPDEVLTLIRPVDEEEEPVASLEEEKKEEKVQEKVEEKVRENDINTWYTIEDGKGRYKGEWKNGLPNGKGIKHFYNTDSYIDGNFVDGFAEGFGKQTFEQTWEKTQPYYEGEFKRNKYNGKGDYYYGDGDYYKGDWKDGKYHGEGAAYNIRLDRTWIGYFENDKKVNGHWVRGEI